MEQAQEVRRGRPPAAAKPVDDTRELLSDFQRKIDNAKMTGSKYVETTDEIISYYNPTGLQGAKYFNYQGIFVCSYGKIEEIEKELEQPHYEKMHGKQSFVKEGSHC